MCGKNRKSRKGNRGKNSEPQSKIAQKAFCIIVRFGIVLKGKRSEAEYRESIGKESVQCKGLLTILEGLEYVKKASDGYETCYKIWQEIFGTANRILEEKGMFFDPYGGSRKHQGYLPVVWHMSVAEDLCYEFYGQRKLWT